MPTVMVTGASGFVGSHVARAAAADPAIRLRVLRHREHPHSATSPTVDVVTGDLGTPRSLVGLCDGVDVLIHCASYIGSNERVARAVNDDGTRALVAAAQLAGVSRVVYLSTAAVYGRGTYRNSRIADLSPSPASPTSRSRAAAETWILEADGLVVRPHLVLGSGDRWVLPRLLRLRQALGAELDRMETRLSAIEVQALGRLLVAAALTPSTKLTGSSYHASHPTPLNTGTVMRAIASAFTLDTPQTRHNSQDGTGSPQADAAIAHDLAMISTDHWFHSDELWRDTGCTPGPGPGSLLPALLGRLSTTDETAPAR